MDSNSLSRAHELRIEAARLGNGAQELMGQSSETVKETQRIILSHPIRNSGKPCSQANGGGRRVGIVGRQ